jgi:hypothetical protein
MALPHFRIRAIRTIYHLYHDSDSRDESGPASQASGTAVAVVCNRLTGRPCCCVGCKSDGRRGSGFMVGYVMVLTVSG